MAEPTILYETVHGSTAYGLARAGSDVDLKGIIVGPASWYHGYRDSPEQIEVSKDHVRFEVRKFFRLASNANPTLIEMLYTAPSFHRVVTPGGQRLLEARDQFLSRRVERSFANYALAQLKRIRSHRAWLTDPPKSKPTREDFGLSSVNKVTPAQAGAGEALVEGGLVTPDDNLVGLLQREKAYRNAKQQYKQYRGWLKNRNPERAALEKQFGYDTKHAQHLVRLLRMALEITRDAAVVVERPDREELLAIRDGAWGYDALVEHAEDLIDQVRSASATSPLPEEPVRDTLDALCQSLVEAVLSAR